MFVIQAKQCIAVHIPSFDSLNTSRSGICQFGLDVRFQIGTARVMDYSTWYEVLVK